MTNVSRRNFLKGAAAGSVSAAALSLLGGYAPAATQAFADEVWREKDWTQIYASDS